MMTFLLGLASAFASQSHDFKVCDSSNVLGVTRISLNPDPPRIGHNLTVTLEGVTQVEVDVSTDLNLKISALGIPIAHKDFDFCGDFGLSCPLSVGTGFTASLSYPIPGEAPQGMQIEAEIRASNSTDEMTCLKLDTSLGMDEDLGYQANAVWQSLYLWENWLEQIPTIASPHFTDFHRATQMIQRHNAAFLQNSDTGGDVGYRLGHNQFSGMTRQEWRDAVLSPIGFEVRRPNHLSVCAVPLVPLVPLEPVGAVTPSSVDWRNHDAVTPVKNQGQCGSCWAFSTTGALEGAYAIQQDKLVSFSEQELVSCDTTDNGCNGGLMDNAFAWIDKQGGLCSESSYPYTAGAGVRGSCRRGCRAVKGSSVKQWVDVNATDAALMEALVRGPVSVAIEADKIGFQLYSSGVYTGKCGTNLDHGVLAVGYGTEDGRDYWLVKNSWDTSWGDAGYIKLARGVSYEKAGGQCGILMSASYPILA